MSLSAVYLAEHGATDKMTFGHGRVEVLAALWSTLSIWLLTGLLVGEAIRRIKLYVDGNAEDINGEYTMMRSHLPKKRSCSTGAMMSLLGALGVLINVVLERVLAGSEKGGHSHSHSHCSAGHSHGHSRTPQHNARKSQELVACLQDEEVGHSHADSEGKEPHVDSHCDEHGHDHGHMVEHNHAHGHSLKSGKSSAANHTEMSKFGGRSNGTYSAVATSEDHQFDAHDGTVVSSLKSMNLNLDVAHLHVLGDLLQSLGVVVAGLVIWVNPNLQIADPICTLIFAVIVLVTTVSMLQRTIVLLLQGAPEYIAVDSLRTNLVAIDAVVDVHDLHVWELTPGRSILSVHIGVDPLSHRTIDDVLSEAHRISQDAGIVYATIQVQKTLGDQCAAGTCFSRSGSQ